MSVLNQVDIAILQSYVNRGESLAYWNYLDAVTLRETGQHNPCAVLLAEIVLVNWYAAAVEAELQMTMMPDDGNLLQWEMTRADLEFRRKDLGSGVELVPVQAEATHPAVAIRLRNSCPHLQGRV